MDARPPPVFPPSLSPSPQSLSPMAHPSICDTRHGWMAGSGIWGGGLTLDPIHVRYGRPAALYDATTSARTWTAYPTCLFFGGPHSRCHECPGHTLRGACGHRPSSARLQTRPIQASRPSGPARHSRRASKQLAHDSSCIVALGRRPSCPIGRGDDHLMWPAVQVTSIGWKGQRGYRTSGG